MIGHVQKKDIIDKMTQQSQVGVCHFENPGVKQNSGRTADPYSYFRQDMPWEQILINRMSFRAFNKDEPVLYHDLVQILLSNASFYNLHWNDEYIEQYVLVSRLNPEGNPLQENRIYKFQPGTENFETVCVIPDMPGKHALFLQKEFADSAIVLFFVGRLEKAVESHEVAGYKQLLIRSGAIAHHGWLCSLTYGYSGSVFSGVLPKVLRKWCGIDGYRRCQLFAYAFGK